MTILIQGAMKEEINILCDYFKPCKSETIHNYDFYICEYNDNKIIISLTQSGIINTTIATMLAVEHFLPNIVINQGCAGGHKPNHNLGDIIIGTKSVYINDFKTLKKDKGKGSSSLDWFPNPKRSYESFSSKSLLDVAKNLSHDKNLTFGILGSGDLHSKEFDRIEYLNSLFHQDCEDMESIAAMKVCDIFGIEKIAMRIISNNELINLDFNKSVCKNMQNFTIRFIDLLIKNYNLLKLC